MEKEILKRKCKDLFARCRFAKEHQKDRLPVIVKSHSSVMLRKLNGVDITLQENKVTNIEIACCILCYLVAIVVLETLPYTGEAKEI